MELIPGSISSPLFENQAPICRSNTLKEKVLSYE